MLLVLASGNCIVAPCVETHGETSASSVGRQAGEEGPDDRIGTSCASATMLEESRPGRDHRRLRGASPASIRFVEV
ncbi:MAG: hypothetical protein R3D28_11825 [Geminicoccaceae bacterium]